MTLAATWMPPEISTLQERSQTKKDTQGVTPLRRNIQNSAWGLMMETDTEGITMCGVTSGKKSHGEGLPEDHVHLGPPCPLPAALHLGAELMHHVPEVMEVGLPLIMLQQGRQVVRSLGEVGHHGRNGKLTAPIVLQAARLQAEAGRVPGLPLPGEGCR